MSGTKIENFKNTVTRLQEAVDNFARDRKNVFSRDALIQRFEFTFETAWKCIMDVLTDEDTWLEILKSRNETAHIYKEQLADAVAKQITTKYVKTFKDLLLSLDKHAPNV